ncbi:MAG TPA: DUF4164 domain-containing protein [Pseudorhodoplanes sp.]|jgi:hypothetical protein|nr:DUF4164 domain-containing protein [Pseudorhodoplanes sp.]
MSDSIAIEQAARRLTLALDALEAAVERRREMDRNEEALTVQLHHLGTDRSRLASDLDHAFARQRQLETTNREIARRLDIAMDTIRAVLEAHGQ